MSLAVCEAPADAMTGVMLALELPGRMQGLGLLLGSDVQGETPR